MFRAADVTAHAHPEWAVDWSTVDVVTDSNALVGLMNWFRLAGSPKTVWPPNQLKLGFDIQPTGGRAIVLKRAILDPEVIRERETSRFGHDVRRYGIHFESVATAPAPGCERGLDHFRVIQYDLGGLRLVVCSEIDAYMPSEADGPLPASPLPPAHPTARLRPRLPLPSRSADIAVVPAGTVLPQSALMELKTEGMPTDGPPPWIHWNRTYPGLFFSQTPLLLTGGRLKDTFMFVHRRRVDSAEFRRTVASWKHMQRGFYRLVALLRRLQKIAPVFGAGEPFTVWARRDRLELEDLDRQAEHSLLGPEDLARFAPTESADACLLGIMCG
ncbi:uncharacterized protein BXZ73DRAFT_102752 [Epithele typhae]|uniref:uncharacterized protein n=1 Tax=Epithele typhae TaxID=378194 RepID=UPI0020077281|nr:uncharacterized protein BXZ73DRAFT_102752 [Epithele typhae]KAH9927163.1 hypothetical protein BXZ73DRAFT_102752 [Epithele typhae]